MTPPPLPNKDREHLRILVICHYVMAGLTLPGIGFLALHYSIMNHVMGNSKMWEKMKDPPPFDPVEFFGYFKWFYLAMGLMLLTSGVLTLMAGRSLQKRKRRVFTIVIAALNCLHFPLGTLLGIFTLIVLSRESVERLYLEEESRREGQVA